MQFLCASEVRFVDLSPGGNKNQKKISDACIFHIDNMNNFRNETYIGTRAPIFLPTCFRPKFFVQPISSNPIRLGLDENRLDENRLDQNELDEN